MVNPIGIEMATQRIREIRERLDALERRTESPFPEGQKTTFSRILEDTLDAEPVFEDEGTGKAASPLEAMIEDKANRAGLDPSLVKAVVKAESGFNPNAVSRVGAKGLMQLMPQTAQGLGVQAILDPAQNVEGGTRYLKTLMEKYHSVPKALAAYNAGPGAVDRFGGIPPYAETQNYVRRVLQYQEQYNQQNVE